MSNEQAKKCPYCSEEILATAKKCKHCGEFLDKELIAEKQKPKEEKPKKKKMGLGKVIVVVIFIFIMIGVISSILDDGKGGGGITNDKKDVALVCAQNKIESMLKSPGTAKYPWDIKAIYDKSTNTYLVGSYVDSQNSFGGEVRSEFVCEMAVKDPKNFICETDCKIK